MIMLVPEGYTKVIIIVDVSNSPSISIGIDNTLLFPDYGEEKRGAGMRHSSGPVLKELRRKDMRKITQYWGFPACIR